MSLQTGQSAAQVFGTGAVLSVGGATGVTGSETFIPVGEIKDAKLSGRKTSTTMATSFASLGIAQKLGTITDLGTATFTYNYIGNDAGQLAIAAAQLTRQAYDFKIQIPMNPLIGQVVKGDLFAFSGIVTEAAGIDFAIDKVSESTLTLDLNSYTITAGS
jgi:hypothetical protein